MSIFSTMVFISILAFANIERYYVDNIRVSKEDYLAIDSTLCRGTEIWTKEDTITYIVYPDIYVRIDTLSNPGHLVVVPRPVEEIRKIKEFFEQHRTSDATTIIGKPMPPFSFVQFADISTCIGNNDLRGKVTLLTFWATWCGPCIQELKSEHLPHIISEFKSNDEFVFLPISVNHETKELTEFFESERGREFDWLKHITLWDKNGEFAKTLSNWGSIPVTVVINKDGNVMLNETGAFLDEEQKDRLRKVIRAALD